MPRLHEIQREFSRYLLGGAPDRIAASIRRDRLAGAQRAQIYRNHLRITLTEALGANFPVVARLVGPDYFAAAARRFIEAHPPSQPVLAEYGAEFPSFLETLPHAPDYLGDVARLEWALNAAAHAPSVPALDAGTVERGALQSLSLRPHPATRLLVSAYPVHRIWRANQPSADPGETVDLGEGGVALLIWRRGAEAMFRALGEADHRFTAALLAGARLSRAAAMALKADALFDLAAMLGFLLGERIFLDPTAQGESP
ncbi:MAG: HvfC/BufC N-terminal domain-containing protein [Rhodospirillales bacterium]